jgi:ABC-type multidrug transport system fused ATPase/permease subunit
MQTQSAYQISKRLSSFQLSNYLNQSYLFHVNNNSAKLLTNITVVPFDLVAGVLLPFIVIINEVIMIITILFIIVINDIALFVALLSSVLPLMLVYVYIHKRRLKEVSDLRDQGLKDMNKSALMSLKGFREIVVYDKKHFFRPIFNNSVNKYTEGNSILYTLNNFAPKVVETLAVTSVVGLFIAGLLLGKSMESLASFLVLFSLAAYKLIPSLNKILQSINNIKASFYVFNYFKNIDLNLPYQSNNECIVVDSELNFKNCIRVSNLHFSYLRDQGFILKDVNIEIKKGTTVGIIGASGSGKSTLLNILLRLYIEDSGGVYIDDKKITSTNLSSWYKKISYVPQDVIVLDGTILENIAFGIKLEKVDFDLLNEVIRKSQLTQLISSLPLGINTQIGESGLRISGGQRQRLAIARALYHKGEILIFDEATSALDLETEKELTESIKQLSNQEITIIIVAHRIQTLKYCSKIYNLDNGNLSLINDLSRFNFE